MCTTQVVGKNAAGFHNAVSCIRTDLNLPVEHPPALAQDAKSILHNAVGSGEAVIKNSIILWQALSWIRTKKIGLCGEIASHVLFTTEATVDTPRRKLEAMVVKESPVLRNQFKNKSIIINKKSLRLTGRIYRC